MKVQYRCMNDECGVVIYGGRRQLDGISCCECNSPVMPEPYNPNELHVPYKRMSFEDIRRKELVDQVKILNTLEELLKGEMSV